MLIGADRTTRATAHVQLPAGTRSFRVRLTSPDALAAGDYSITVRSRSAQADASPSSDTLHLVLPSAPDVSGGLFTRRSQTTGNKDTPTADVRFRRTEQIRVEIPTTGTESASARLLDRTGKPLSVPVQSAIRADADGSRWQTAQLALAPLAPGDYLIEVSRGPSSTGSTAATTRTLVAFRVVP
jgi:hypothetical protein